MSGVEGPRYGWWETLAFEGSHGPVFLLIMKNLIVIETLEHAEHKHLQGEQPTRDPV
jgi:hypothetical protein